MKDIPTKINKYNVYNDGDRLLGMGDMLSFIEKAQQTYDEKQAKKLEEKLRKNRLNLSDYLDQLEQLQKPSKPTGTK